MEDRRANPVPFQPGLNLQEVSGSLGDLGTFLPLTLALAQVCGVPLAASFLVAGLGHLITAARYPIPIPVQPMKAIAALAIAGGLSAASVHAAGLIMAAIVLLLAGSGLASRLQDWIPLPLVRGLQLGLGALLALRGLDWLAPGLSGDLLPWTLAALALAAAGLRWRLPAALAIVALGTVWIWPTIAAAGLRPAPPSLAWPGGDDFAAALPMVAAQLPTTLLNSVLAVVVLSQDLFPRLPKRAVTARGLCTTVGGLNLLGGVLGGTPVCHGSGGLAAQYRFGARGNGALIIQGTIKVVLALAAGGTLSVWVAAFPRPLLGVLVLVAGGELIRVGLRLPGRSNGAVAGLVATGVLLHQTLIGVTLGGGLYWLLRNRCPPSEETP